MLSVFPSTLPPQAPLPSILSLCWDETTPLGNTFPFKGRLLQAAWTLRRRHITLQLGGWERLQGRGAWRSRRDAGH